MVTIVDDDVEEEMRMTTHTEIEHMLAEDSDDDMNVTPQGNYTQHFIVYDLDRVRPAYKINFHLDQETVEYNTKSALKNAYSPKRVNG